MPENLAFRRTFGIAVVIGVIDWALPLAVVEKTLYAGALIGYALLLAFGFLAVREGRRYVHVFTRTWAFVAFWFVLGTLTFIFGRGEVPADWSPEKEHSALLGYVVATFLLLPVAFVLSGLGFGIAHILSKFRHDPPSAA